MISQVPLQILQDTIIQSLAEEKAGAQSRYRPSIKNACKLAGLSGACCTKRNKIPGQQQQTVLRCVVTQECTGHQQTCSQYTPQIHLGLLQVLERVPLKKRPWGMAKSRRAKSPQEVSADQPWSNWTSSHPRHLVGYT